MPHIVEYRAGVPAASEALNAASDATGRHDAWYADDDGTVWTFWVAGDVDGFTDALTHDPSVASFERTVERPDEHLFEVRLAVDDGGFDPPVDVELLSARFDSNGLTGWAWCASPAAADALRDAMGDAFGWFEVVDVYELDRGDEGRTVHVTADEYGADDLVVAITEAIADAEDVAVDDLPPMYDAVDPDLVTGILRADGGHDNFLSFRYHGHRVVVRGDGTVTVT